MICLKFCTIYTILISIKFTVPILAVPEKVATTCTEDGHKYNTKTSITI
jgi:hypothetical protein